MATKTITLELDAYEKLRTAKKGGESFSEVVRRAEFTHAPLTGENLRAYLRSGGSGVSDRYLNLNAVEEAAKHDPAPDNPTAPSPPKARSSAQMTCGSPPPPSPTASAS